MIKYEYKYTIPGPASEISKGSFFFSPTTRLTLSLLSMKCCQPPMTLTFLTSMTLGWYGLPIDEKIRLHHHFMLTYFTNIIEFFLKEMSKCNILKCNVKCTCLKLDLLRKSIWYQENKFHQIAESVCERLENGRKYWIAAFFPFHIVFNSVIPQTCTVTHVS